MALNRSLGSPGELLVTFIGSPQDECRIIAININGAMNIEGIAGVFTAKDVPGENWLGPVFVNTELLAVTECRYRGQPIVALAGESVGALHAARTSIHLELSPPSVVAGGDVPSAVSGLTGACRRILRGDPPAALARAEHTLEGTFRTGNGGHVKDEALPAHAFVGDNGQIVIHAVTQYPSEVRSAAARCLGVREDRVVCFGAPASPRSARMELPAAHAAVLAALVAFKTSRPVRIVDPGDLDSRVFSDGQSQVLTYKVGFASDGRMTALLIDHNSESARAAEVHGGVELSELLNGDNAYFVPHFAVTWIEDGGRRGASVAHRDVAAAQAVAVMENIIEEIAGHLGLDPLEVRRRNCDGKLQRDTTQSDRGVSGNALTVVLDRLAEATGYTRRRDDVIQFNNGSRTHLRGLALTVVKHGIASAARNLRDGMAQVDIDAYGTIRVAIGRPEMARTLNMIFRQRVADQFAMPSQAVLVVAKSTESPDAIATTSASAGVDLDGTAALRACEILRNRLADLAAKNFGAASDDSEASAARIVFEQGRVFDLNKPDRSLGFNELVAMAHQAKVDLSARGFYVAPIGESDLDTATTVPHAEFSVGAALSEVEIERATGRLTATSVEILIDVGVSSDPAGDRGRVFAGFIRGMGWATSDLRPDSPETELLSRSTTIDRVPNFNGLPRSVKVDFLEVPDRHTNFRVDKSIGALPFLLGISVWAATKQALTGHTGGQPPALNLPATAVEILRCLQLAVRVDRDAPA